MTIRDRSMNTRYGYFLACAENAPEGTFEDCKKAADGIGYLADTILEKSREIGLPVSNSDGIRNIEVAIYREMVENQPVMALAAEGAGANLDNPVTRDDTIRSLIRDRDFLKGTAA